MWELLLGILYIAIGVDVLLHPAAGLAALTLVARDLPVRGRGAGVDLGIPAATGGRVGLGAV